MSTPRPGYVWLVGAGPGDPGLITLRGAEALSMAEVVVYDHLASARLLDLAPAAALRVCAGKSSGHCTLAQDEINRLLVTHAHAGKQVVRLKGGDPFVFGRGAEEAEYLAAAGVGFEVVPGVTAGVGVTAYAGVPVTHRDEASAVAFVTGHHDPEAVPEGAGRLDWNALARFPGTLVIYMGLTRLTALSRALIARGKPADTPAGLIQWGTVPAQRAVWGTLASLPELVAEARLGPPALLVVGSVVSRRGVLRWFENRPLFGQRIVVTRPADESARALADLERLGAEALAAPTVTIGPPPDFGPLDSALARLATFEWLVFTSANGVRYFVDRLEARGLDLRALGHLRLAAIGPSTAEALRRLHLTTDLVPDAYRSEALAAELATRAAGKRVLLARADRGRTVLKDTLEQVADVEQVPAYTNADATALPPTVVERLEEGSVDWITLTSSAITERLHVLMPGSARANVGRSIRLASISPVTTAAATRLGWPVAVEATSYTWEGLVRAILDHVTREKT